MVLIVNESFLSVAFLGNIKEGNGPNATFGGTGGVGKKYSLTAPPTLKSTRSKMKVDIVIAVHFKIARVSSVTTCSVGIP